MGKRHAMEYCHLECQIFSWCNRGKANEICGLGKAERNPKSFRRLKFNEILINQISQPSFKEDHDKVLIIIQKKILTQKLRELFSSTEGDLKIQIK